MPHGKKKVQQVTTDEAGADVVVNDKPRNKTVFIIIGVILVIMAIIGGVLYYRSSVAPFQRPVVIIDKTSIRMDYFLKRVKLAGGDPVSTLNRLIQEQLVKEQAPQFGKTVTAQDIDNALLYSASTSNSENATENVTASISEAEYKTWYRQQLERTGLTDAEYRDMVKTNMLAAGMQQLLAENTPTSADQILLNVIVVANSQDASKAKARIAAGESFAAVARAVSLDTQTKDKGGEIGWMPPGVLPYDSVTFSLEVGTVSNPVLVDQTQPTSQYLLFMVSEKATNRKIDDNWLQVLKSKALYNYLTQEVSNHTIDVTFDFNNPQNQAWIDWQLAKASNR